MYWKDIWRFKNSIEYEYKFAGNFGAKGEKRQKKEKATPEQIRKQNQRNRENRMRRKMKANFGENDIWATLKFPKGTRMEREEVMEVLNRFTRRIRYRYRKRGQPMKFICRIEIGKRGSPHIHILLNRIPDADLILKECWNHGRVDFTLAYEAGGFQKLAEYITKPPLDEVDPEHETKNYSCSRNLIDPVPERKEYKRRTMERMIRDGIKPSEGFYIDRDSVYYGTNPFTGMTYLKYIEYRMPKGGIKGAKGKSVHNCEGEGDTNDGRVLVLCPGDDLEGRDVDKGKNRIRSERDHKRTAPDGPVPGAGTDAKVKPD